MRLILLSILTFLITISTATAQDRRPIKVLTWNIFMRPHAITFDGQFRRAKAIGELLQSKDYDIILFQEAFGKTSRKKLRKTSVTGSFWKHRKKGRN